ncbi:Brp/Blh family beta-carotene 15,15'-dioxygenase [Natranaeroarchaeum aerophilus]|uniref:Probable beta-carotene 15,15'-dioxygenase n=1 Tax=Natranaeroarchaeum aerophilus TaxID=2917711 RepID=A0AAE3FT09_9EURY|nr:Brp/Blh family beta-carotene 15,15'-dioxygenase [Natranaeroarchaeum aerophilus]MCL9814779.1 Brp/Blh family beta-carotene 15,15'-dioxygenase [Natranaeroarchaeum aerophilus]
MSDTSSPTAERLVAALAGRRLEGAARLALLPGWITLLATSVLVTIVGTEIPLSIQLAPLFLSVLLLGLPHGAVDHLVTPRARGTALTIRSMAEVGVVYAVLGSGYAVVWFLSPAAAFVFFILLTWFHWGQGDIHPVRELVGGNHVRGPGGTALTALVRGGAPMLVPLVAFPGEYRRVAEWIVGVVDPGAVGALDPFFTAEARLLVAALYGALVVGALSLGWVRRTDSRPWRIDAVETGLLVGFFATVPPLLAIGLYFCFWHSLRHIVRFLLLDEHVESEIADGAVVTPLSRFARDAAPLTALSLVFGVALYLLLPGAATDPGSLMGVYLVFIAVLTLPHVAFVSVLDYYDGFWR